MGVLALLLLLLVLLVLVMGGKQSQLLVRLGLTVELGLEFDKNLENLVDITEKINHIDMLMKKISRKKI